VFHMCFTRDKHEKVTYLKDAGMWLLRDEPVCTEGGLREAKPQARRCCTATPAFPEAAAW
jgi:hypothetical protein